MKMRNLECRLRNGELQVLSRFQMENLNSELRTCSSELRISHDVVLKNRPAFTEAIQAEGGDIESMCPAIEDLLR